MMRFVVLLAPLAAAGDDDAPATLTYRSFPPPPQWAPATHLLAGRDRPVAIWRRGGTPLVAPADADAYAWAKRPGAWAEHLRTVYGAAANDTRAYPRPEDVEILPDLRILQATGHGSPRLVKTRGEPSPSGPVDAAHPTYMSDTCPRRRDLPFKRLNWHAPFSNAAYVNIRSALDGPAAPAANGSWVEVTHCGGSKFEESSAWFYALRGSGISLNLGKTLAFENHQDASIYFLGRPCRPLFSNNEKMGVFQ